MHAIQLVSYAAVLIYLSILFYQSYALCKLIQFKFKILRLSVEFLKSNTFTVILLSYFIFIPNTWHNAYYDIEEIYCVTWILLKKLLNFKYNYLELDKSHPKLLQQNLNQRLKFLVFEFFRSLYIQKLNQIVSYMSVLTTFIFYLKMFHQKELHLFHTFFQ